MRVTDALKLLGFIDDEWLTDEARHRGTVIHLLTQYDDEGTLDPATVDPRVAEKLEGWRKFKHEKNVKILNAEFKVDYEPLGMTGTPDRLVEIDGVVWLLDIKSGARSWWHRWQVALYALLYSLKTGQPAPKRCVVYLLENDYRWDQFTDRKDIERARSIIATAHIKAEAA
jgi:hypothetical protein